MNITIVEFALDYLYTLIEHALSINKIYECKCIDI